MGGETESQKKKWAYLEVRQPRTRDWCSSDAVGMLCETLVIPLFPERVSTNNPQAEQQGSTGLGDRHLPYADHSHLSRLRIIRCASWLA